MRSWDEISTAVKETENLHQQWDKDEESPTVTFEYREVKAVSQKLDTQWSNLHDLVCVEKIEPAAYELVMAIDTWIDEVDKFRDDIHSNPGGTKELWQSWDQVLQLAKERPRPLMLEGINYLAKVQKCSPQQIAKIYEWKDQFGQPDVRRVLAVIETGVDEPTVSPHYQRKIDRIAKLWEARQSRTRQVIESPVPEKPLPVVAPESIEILLEQNVPSRQIARMKNIDQQTVIDYAREIGMVVDGHQPPPSMTPEQHLANVRINENEMLKEAKEFKAQIANVAEAHNVKLRPETYESLNNYKEQVRQMTLDGCTKQQIIEGLQNQHPKRTKPSSVAQIMAAVEREAAASQE
ncbi:MAG: hypothetical protein ACO23H_03210 [Alphaproteobacteria bacterium]